MENNPMPKITDAFLAEVAAGLYHSVSREWAMKMAQEVIEARKKRKEMTSA